MAVPLRRVVEQLDEIEDIRPDAQRQLSLPSRRDRAVAPQTLVRAARQGQRLYQALPCREDPGACTIRLGGDAEVAGPPKHVEQWLLVPERAAADFDQRVLDLMGKTLPRHSVPFKSEPPLVCPTDGGSPVAATAAGFQE